MTIAARNGHLKILQLFVENLPSIITNSARSWYLLMHAALRGQLHVVKFLIGQGVPVIHVDKSARTSSIVDAAVLKGHLPVVKYIIEEIKFADRSHNSADPLLCLATHAGHLDMVKYLVKCGASFTCQHFYPFGGSAFDIAMDEGWADIASFFLGNATLEDLDIITTSGWKWMSKPCNQDKFGHIFYPSPWKKPSIAHMILDRVDLEKQLTTITPLEQAYLLAVAAETGNMPLIQRLLDKGCSPVLSELKYSPMTRALNDGHVEIVETLLRCPEYPISELDVQSAAKKGKTAIVLGLLHKVEKPDFKKFAKIALDAALYPDKFMPVMSSVLDILSDQDVDTLISMVTSSSGHQASRVGHLEATSFLLEKTAKQPFDTIPKCLDILRQGSEEPTSLLEHAAAVCPVAQFQVALAHWRLELDPDNDDCKAALVAAVLCKNKETIQLFIEKGFYVTSNYIHRGELLPLLHLAVETLKDGEGTVIDWDDWDNEQEVRGRQFHYPNGRPRLDHIHPRSSIQLLVEHGAEINQVDANGRTALFLTTERNNLVLTKELLRLGANPLLKTSANVSALELAISKCQTKHVKAFLKAIEIHSFTCDNFSSLNPDVLPPEKLPNRAPTCASAQFHIFATDFLSVEGIIARNGWMDQPRGSRVPVWCRKSPQNWEEILEESSEESSEEDSDESSGEGSDEEWDNYSVSLQKEGTEEDNFVPIWSATKDDDSISDPRWARFFIAKAMT
ncbi:hypothetical protein CBS147332_3181 [Penicillium roqueforti]|nr:hypothetical protein CBS147332_3181 [Penicillium roqueforti]KAI3125605.1 hypothetical protein CBS147331_599 [Penicillium roqueforti]